MLLGTLLAGCTTEPGTGAAGDDGASDGVTGTDPSGPDATDTGTGTGSDTGTGTDPTGTTPPSAPTNNALPVYPTQHPRIYLTPNRSRLAAALSARTTPATRFKSLVDQWVAGSDIWGFSAWNAALLGQLTGSATYCTKAVATIEAQVVAAEAKIAVNQAPLVAGDSYLEVGDLIGDLALVYDWCLPQVSSSQRSRWIAYANQAVWNVWNYTQAKWGSKTIPWSGWSVDNPSNNYYYSFLRATMLLGLATNGENAQAATWLTQFREALRFVSEYTPPVIDGAFAAALREELTTNGTPHDPDAVKAMNERLKKGTGLKGKELFMPLRLALTGLDHGPELVRAIPLLQHASEVDPNVLSPLTRIERCIA